MLKAPSPSRAFVALAILGLPLALFFPALAGGRMLWGADIETLGLVFKTSIHRSLSAGEWPQWMPEILCGIPGIASSNLDFLHPLELAFSLLRLPPWVTFGLDAAAEVAASGAGVYLLLRLMGLSRAAGLVGALGFAASGSQLSLLYAGHVNNVKAIAMIPWVFWGAAKGFQERRPLGWALCGAALALQALGIGLQIFAYTLIALAFFAAWLAWRDAPLRGAASAAWDAVKGVAVAGVAAFLLAAPQLLPSLQYKSYSWREDFSYEQFIGWSFDPKECLTWIVPGFWGWRDGSASWAWPSGAAPAYHGAWPFCLTTEYFGLLPWALAFAACAALAARESWARRLRRPEAFFVGLALFSFLSGVGKYFPLHLLYFHLPVFGAFRTWTRFLCLVTFSVCVLAGFGWDALMSGTGWAKAWKAALAFTLLALACCLGAFLAAPGSVSEAAASLVQKAGPQAPADALELARSSSLRGLALAGLLLAALLSWQRLRGIGMPLLLAALAFHAVDESEVARRYLEFKPPAEVMQRPDWLGVLPDGASGEPFRILDLPGVWRQNSGALFGYETVQGYHGMQMSAPLRLLKALSARQMDWADLMGARYIISPSPVGGPGFKALTQGPPYVYENPGALPRAFLVGRSRAVDDPASAWAVLSQPGFDLLHSVTLPVDAGLDSAKPEGRVAWVQRGRNFSVLEADTARRSVLVLTQTWYPAWEALVDGASAPLLAADGGALQAVVLQPGAHRVELRYSSRLLEASGVLSALGLALLAALALRPKVPA